MYCLIYDFFGLNSKFQNAISSTFPLLRSPPFPRSLPAPGVHKFGPPIPAPPWSVVAFSPHILPTVPNPPWANCQRHFLLSLPFCHPQIGRPFVGDSRRESLKMLCWLRQ